MMMIKINNLKKQELQNIEYNNDNFVNRIKNIKLSLFSPEEIESLSHGEITSSETLHYKTHLPIPGGLYCQRIFGPIKDWSCSCGKYTGKLFKNTICNECKVQVNSSNVRRKRIGHIKLATPIIHTWFYLGNYNNYISTLLNINNKVILDVIHYEKFILLDIDFEKNFEIQIIEKEDVSLLQQTNEEKKKRLRIGTEGLFETLKEINLNKLLEYQQSISRKTDNKRIMFIKQMIKEESDITKIFITLLPVLPCDLRPIVPLSNGVLGTTDINHLYRLIVLRNNRINVLKEIRVPEIILRHAKIILQKAVDALFDNSRLKKPVKAKTRNLKSIADELNGKQGILRANLLGKRVDFSARSVIVIEPKLKLTDCAIPIEMAAELFKLEITRKLLKNDPNIGVNEAIEKVKSLDPETIDILNKIITNRYILLNRAPTLHRNSLQAFRIKLTEGRAIKIHPLICEGFNADCDGDLMAVYLSILPSTMIENKVLMNVVGNIFSFANGQNIVRPIREILMGCYYATIELPDAIEYKLIVKNTKDLIDLYENNKVEIHDKIKLFFNNEIINTTVGRVLINECFPEQFRNYTILIGKKFIENITIQISDMLGNEVATTILDELKLFGFKYATKYAFSLSLEDMISLEEKDDLVKKTSAKSLEITNLITNKFLTKLEGENQNIQNWSNTIEYLKDIMSKISKNCPLNDLFLSVNSEARGSMDQVRQLSIMRGLISDTTGKIIDHPVLSSYKDGLIPIDYFISSFGSRKGVVDRALKTANAGYLTRKLVVLSSSVVISNRDCGTINGIIFTDILGENGEIVISKFDRIKGRVLAENIIDFQKGHIFTEKDIEILKDKNIIPKIRSVIHCESENLCTICYGIDLARRCLVAIGTPVGIIAAQSIGEPALQLTMRTFHTGGASSVQEEQNEIFSKEDGTVNFVCETNKIYQEYENFYKYMVIKKGYILINNKKILVEKGDILHVHNQEEVKEGDIILTKNSKTEVFISTNRGILKIIEGTINKINGENIINSYYNKNCMISVGGRMISIPNGSNIFFDENEEILENTLIAKRPHVISVSQDIVDSLKNVEHILENRKTKTPAIQTNISGTFDYDIIDDQTVQPIAITIKEERIKIGKLCHLESLIVKKGEKITEGQKITYGLVDFNKILTILSKEKAMIYMINEIKSQYIERKIQLDDKHIEIIIKKMFSFGVITKSNNFRFNIGTTIPLNAINKENLLAKNDEEIIQYSPKCLGITKACLNSTSFISATSFQNTRNMLAKAAFFNQKDELEGIEENILVGNPIPAGTGTKVGIEEIFENLTRDDKILPLSLFLKKVNPFYFVNICLGLIEKRIEREVGFIENNNNWINEIIIETQKFIVDQNLESQNS